MLMKVGVMPRRNYPRKTNGGYWTVRYVNDNGMFYNVGNFATRLEALTDIMLDPFKYPPGEGKVIFTK